MDRRLELQALLQSIIGVRQDGKANVYFQAPGAELMNYPCILYSLSDIDKKCADNQTYSMRRLYQVTIIDRNPDTDLIDKVFCLPMCQFDRHYTADNLNHDVFNLYF